MTFKQSQQNDSNEIEIEQHLTALKEQQTNLDNIPLHAHKQAKRSLGGELEARQAKEVSWVPYGGSAMSGGVSGELPSSPGNSGSNSSGGNSNGMPKLNITKQPPSHAFVDEWLDIEINLDPSSGYLGPFGAVIDSIELQADLHGYDTNGPWSEPILSGARVVVDGTESIRIPLKSSGKSRRVAKARCKINASVRSDRLTQFRIRFSPKDGLDEALMAIRPVFTKSITMVTAKLKIQTEEWESVWYKDEGGRDKCMSAQAVLCDKDGNPILKRRVPLKLTLLYDNGESLKVMKQEILRVLGPPKHSIDPDTAMSAIQFRIEDVSKNHQGMDFKVEVAPDSSKVADVAPVFTPSVSVRSKRNKRQRSVSSSSTRPLPMDSRQASSMAQQMPPPISSPMRSYSAGDQSQAGLTGVSDISRLRQAMKGVIQWTEEVVNGLYPLKWQIIGYAQFPDGSVDYNRPYHSMPNPNACISKVLSLYSDETREHLRVLLTAVENTRPSPEPEAPSSYGGSEEGYRGLGPQTPAQQSTAMQQAQGQMMSQSSASVPYSAGAPPAPSPYGVMPGQAMGHQGMYMDQGTPLHGRVGGPPPMQWQPPPYAYSPPGHHPMHPAHMGTASQGPMHPPQSGASSERGEQIAQLEAMQEGQAEEDIDAEAGQADIEYILAKQHKSLRTGERLGFPCYNATKEIIGFIRESSMKVGVGQFIPISKHGDEFGPMEMAQATRILEEAIGSNNQALHSKEAWGTVASLIDHALVYEWSKEIPGTASDS